MKLYRIKNWDANYEYNRSRKIAKLQWVLIPNNQTSDGYCTIMAQENPAEIYAAWILILQVASRCEPRGTLLRSNGTPHTPATLAIKTRGRIEWFEAALKLLSCDEIGWMEFEENPELQGSNGIKCQSSDGQVTVKCQSSDSQVTVKCQSGGAKVGLREDREDREEKRINNNPPSGGSTQAPKKKTQIPADWKPSATHEKFCADEGIDLAAATEEFVSWAEASGNKYANWDVCFSRGLRNWIPDNLKSRPSRNAPARDATGSPLRRMMPWGWSDAADADAKKAEWMAQQKEAVA